MNKQRNKAFTLVELIVVITILAILGTIAFISLQGYSKSARDSKRISDISNIKKSLELFALNTGKYPIPDKGETVSYSGETLWTQGVIGDNVSRNLSKNLQEKPTDPLHGTEYIYSITHSQREYEILTIFENEISTKNLLTDTYAFVYKPIIKISGNFNGIFVRSTNYIVPTPSIINSEITTGGITLNNTNIDSQVISGGNNIPNLGIPNIEQKTGELNINLSPIANITSESSKQDKENVINAIQNAYTGTTLASNPMIQNILSTTNKELLAEDLVLQTSTSSNSTSTEPEINNCEATSETINTHTYNITSINSGSSESITSELYAVSNGKAQSEQTFSCDDGTLSSTGSENETLMECDTDYYSADTTTCTSVGNGYYSDSTSKTRIACSTKPTNSTYTSSGNGTDNCSWSCDSGYTENAGSCNPITCSWVLNYTYSSSPVNCRSTYPTTSNPSGTCTCGTSAVTVYECNATYLAQCSSANYGCKPLREYTCQQN